MIEYGFFDPADAEGALAHTSFYTTIGFTNKFSDRTVKVVVVPDHGQGKLHRVWGKGFEVEFTENTGGYYVATDEARCPIELPVELLDYNTARKSDGANPFFHTPGKALSLQEMKERFDKQAKLDHRAAALRVVKQITTRKGEK